MLKFFFGVIVGAVPCYLALHVYQINITSGKPFPVGLSGKMELYQCNEYKEEVKAEPPKASIPERLLDRTCEAYQCIENKESV